MIPSPPATSDRNAHRTAGSDRSAVLARPAPSTRQLRPGPVAQLFERLSLPALAARFAFPQRFDQAARRLAADVSGGAVSPRQAAAYFGHRLFIEIDPQQLTHRLDEKFFVDGEWHWVGANFLDTGCWQNRLSLLDHSPAHREIVEICRIREDFRDGSHYRRYVRQIELGHPPRRNGRHLDTVDELDAYFRYYVDLVDNIARTGILPRNRFQSSMDTGRHHRSARSFWHDLVERDIGVAIGKDGRLVRHTSGKHRLAAAIGLGIQRIPVEIRMIHVGWLQRQMHRLELPPAQALAAALEERAFG